MGKLTVPEVKQPEVYIYADSEYEMTITNAVEFEALRAQIKQNGITGVEVEFNEVRYPIDVNGKVQPKHPEGLFDDIDKFLDILLGLDNWKT